MKRVTSLLAQARQENFPPLTDAVQRAENAILTAYKVSGSQQSITDWFDQKYATSKAIDASLEQNRLTASGKPTKRGAVSVLATATNLALTRSQGRNLTDEEVETVLFYIEQVGAALRG